MIRGVHIALRPVEFTDAPILMSWENDEANWSVSERETPYTFSEIIQLIDSSKSLENAGQIRFMIIKLPTQQSIGTLDLFEWRKASKIISVGILIQEQINRKKGFALEALSIVESFLENYQIGGIDCTVQESNLASIRLFEKAGFQIVEGSENNGELKMEKWLRK